MKNGRKPSKANAHLRHGHVQIFWRKPLPRSCRPVTPARNPTPPSTYIMSQSSPYVSSPYSLINAWRHSQPLITAPAWTGRRPDFAPGRTREAILRGHRFPKMIPKTSHPGFAANYILQNLSPDPKTGRPRRAMVLLFKGDDAVRKVRSVVAISTDRRGVNHRDTYGRSDSERRPTGRT